MLEDVADDIAELKMLLAIAQRRRVRRLLESEITELDAVSAAQTINARDNQGHKDLIPMEKGEAEAEPVPNNNGPDVDAPDVDRIPDIISSQRAGARLIDKRMADSMIQYELLRDQLQRLHSTRGTEIEAAKQEVVQDRCCVCLDDLGCSAFVTKTACGHIMHAMCLVESLADGTIKGCPMCRTDVSQLAGNDMSGELFRFMCQFRMNADMVQSCTRTQKKEILRELDSCGQEAVELKKWSVQRLLRPSEQTERRLALKLRLFNVRKRLQLLEQFSYANNEGFRDICKQIGNNLGKELEDCCMSDFAKRMDCFCDVGASAEYVRIADRLASAFKTSGVERAEIEAHEKMLRMPLRKGIALPSFVQAHFSSTLDEWLAGCQAYSILWTRKGDKFVAKREFTTQARKEALRKARHDDKTFSSESMRFEFPVNGNGPIATSARTKTETVITDFSNMNRRELAKEFGIKKIHFVPLPDGSVVEYGTPSDEDVQLPELVELSTMALDAAKLSFHSHAQASASLTVSLAKSRFISQGGKASEETAARTDSLGFPESPDKPQTRDDSAVSWTDSLVSALQYARSMAPGLPRSSSLRDIEGCQAYSILWTRKGDKFVAKREFTTQARKEALRKARHDDKTFSSESMRFEFPVNGNGPIATSARTKTETVITDFSNMNRRELAKEFGIKKIHFVPLPDGSVVEYGTPSDEDVQLPELVELSTMALDAAKLSFQGRMQASASLTVSLAKSRFMDETPPASPENPLPRNDSLTGLVSSLQYALSMTPGLPRSSSLSDISGILSSLSGAGTGAATSPPARSSWSHRPPPAENQNRRNTLSGQSEEGENDFGGPVAIQDLSEEALSNKSTNPVGNSNVFPSRLSRSVSWPDMTSEAADQLSNLAPLLPMYNQQVRGDPTDNASSAARPSSNKKAYENKFWALEQKLESELGSQDLDQSYLLAKSRLPVDSPYVGSFHRFFVGMVFEFMCVCLRICRRFYIILRLSNVDLVYTYVRVDVQTASFHSPSCARVLPALGMTV